MKILYYYWVPCHDLLKRGGGIRVYQENLLREAQKHSECSCTFLSAGLIYSLDGRVRIEQVSGKDLLCPSYEIVNSPVMSPAVMQFGDLKTYLTDETVLPVLEQFWREQGGFDVFHIQSMEGLPLNALRIKEKFPDTKIVFSLHNYSMFCPQVNLWAREQKNCVADPDFPNCSLCMEPQSPKMERLFASIKYAQGAVSDVKGSYRDTLLFKTGKHLASTYRNLRYRLAKPDENQSKAREYTETEENRALYRAYREQNVAALNRWCDSVIAVSQRVAEIAQQMGIERERLSVSYIGTAFAEKQAPGKVPAVRRPLKLAYLGYARRDKGFYFLMDTILKGDAAVWKQVDLLLAVRTEDPECLSLIREAGKKVHSVEHKNGYTAKELASILRDVDLGIVPVLWEDNLPQVSMELRSFGVPVLASDAGGAHELSDCPELIFRAGNSRDLEKKLSAVLEQPRLLQRYWDNIRKLPSMGEHWEALMAVYQPENKGRNE